jgi:hypothetical protein
LIEYCSKISAKPLEGNKAFLLFEEGFELIFRFFYTFAIKEYNMASFTLTPETAEKVKIKFLRKYRDLVQNDIAFTPGEEDRLVEQLMDLVKRDRKYVEFTISKALADPDGNRL